MFADDEGNLERSAKQLKGQAFPHDRLEVEPLLAELINHELVVEYQVDGKKLLHIKGFKKHQRINRPSPPRFPAYDDSLRTHGGLTEDSHPRARAPEVEVEVEGKGVTTFAPARRITFDGLNFQGITEAQELQWQQAYPAVPIPPAIAQAAAWLKANPANRKVNCERYLVNWFKRDQDKAGRVKR